MTDELTFVDTNVLIYAYDRPPRSMSRPLSPLRARRIITRYATCLVHRVEPDDILHASELGQRSSLSFRDALVIVAAARLGAARLLTEDLQHGQMIAGVRIENPFVGSSPER